MALEVDQNKVGKKGYPRHWQALGLDAPMKEAPDNAQADDPQVSVPPTKAQLIAYAASARWKHETGGMTLPGGIVITTDITAQTKIAAAKTAFDNGTLTGTIAFKAVSGWLDADAAAVTAVYEAVVAHVQAGYALEKSIVDQIEAEAITTTAEIDEAFTT